MYEVWIQDQLEPDQRVTPAGYSKPVKHVNQLKYEADEAYILKHGQDAFNKMQDEWEEWERKKYL